MAVNLLSNVRVAAISIVTKGANRKRFFLRKAAEGEELLELPSSRRLVKAADWSAVYAVVAEPEWLEDAGQHGDQDVPDRWADENEIRKAAHEFVKGGGLINLMHESLEPYGQLVESAVALDDFQVDGETIRKGSWYIAFEPNELARSEIEEGKFTGISIQGTGTRSLEKAKPFEEAKHPRKGGKFAPKGTAAGAATPKGEKAATKDEAQQNRDNTAANILSSLGGYKGMKLSDAVRAFQRKHGLEETGQVDAGTLKTMRSKQGGRREKQRGGATEIGTGKKKGKKRGKMAKGSSADVATMDDRVERGLLHKIAEKVGLSTEEIEAIEKAQRPGFAERMAERELDEELPQAFDVLRSVIWSAFYPMPNEENPEDPEAAISRALDEFKSWALDLLDKVPVSKIVEQLDEDAEWNLAKATLSAADRKKLPKSAFVFPEKAPGSGSYPIHDLAHAKNAKARASGKPEEGKVFAAVHRKFPQLKPKKGEKVSKAEGSTKNLPKVEDMSEEHQETAEERTIEERVDSIEETLSKLDPEKLAEAVAKAVKEEKPEEPTAEDLSKKLDDLTEDFAGKLETLGEDVKKLGAGGTAQGGDPNEEVSEEEIAKAFKDRDLDPNLAGLLS